MRAAEGPRPAELPAIEHAGHGLDHRDLQQFLRCQWRQQSRRAGGQHRLAGAGRADHEQIVPSGHSHFERALGRLLSAHIP